MRIPIHQVDAFTSQLFHGNPAAVCPLASWLDDATLQSIAAENNLSETAFLVGGNGAYEIRWMTPTREVDLCGHATLASAFVLFVEAEKGRDELVFQSKGGELRVRREDDLLTLDFPARPPQPMTAGEDLLEGLGRPAREVWGAARDYLAVFESEDEVRRLAPDFERLSRLDGRAVIVTAPGTRVDFVSRFFAPTFGIPEDPVTGSSHCTLVPFWSRRLGKKRLHALQVSPRGGELFCEDRGDRVAISGRAVRYLQGTIEV
jgi:PhzF family phenazine biosynthesis protein